MCSTVCSRIAWCRACTAIPCHFQFSAACAVHIYLTGNAHFNAELRWAFPVSNMSFLRCSAAPIEFYGGAGWWSASSCVAVTLITPKFSKSSFCLLTKWLESNTNRLFDRLTGCRRVDCTRVDCRRFGCRRFDMVSLKFITLQYWFYLQLIQHQVKRKKHGSSCSIIYIYAPSKSTFLWAIPILCKVLLLCDEGYLCGGTLVTKSTVITAGHCCRHW